MVMPSKFKKLVRIFFPLILLLVFIEILILLPRPQTSISYGIPPTNGQIPWQQVGFASKTLEKTRVALDSIRKTQQKVYMHLKLRTLGLDEANFVIESKSYKSSRAPKIIMKVPARNIPVASRPKDFETSGR